MHGKGKDQHGRRGDDARGHRARGHRRHRPLHRRGARRPVPTTATAGWPPPAAAAGGATPSSSPTAAGRRRFAEQGEHGEERWLQARAQADGRRRPRRVPERRQEHADQRDLGGQAEDRRLPVHHARAEPRRGAPRRRHRVRRRRHPRPHRGGQRGPRPRPPVPPPHRAGPGAVPAGRPRRRSTACRRPSRSGSCSHELARYRPELLDRPRLVVGTKADIAVAAPTSSRRSAGTGRVISAVTGEGVRAARRAHGRARPRGPPGRAPSADGVVVLPPEAEGAVVERDRRRRVPACVGREVERVVALNDVTTPEALSYIDHRLERLGVDKAAGPGRRRRTATSSGSASSASSTSED